MLCLGWGLMAEGRMTVVALMGAGLLTNKALKPGLWLSKELASMATGWELCLISCAFDAKLVSFSSVKWRKEFRKLDKLLEEAEFRTGKDAPNPPWEYWISFHLLAHYQQIATHVKQTSWWVRVLGNETSWSQSFPHDWKMWKCMHFSVKVPLTQNIFSANIMRKMQFCGSRRNKLIQALWLVNVRWNQNTVNQIWGGN